MGEYLNANGKTYDTVRCPNCRHSADTVLALEQEVLPSNVPAPLAVAPAESVLAMLTRATHAAPSVDASQVTVVNDAETLPMRGATDAETLPMPGATDTAAVVDRGAETVTDEADSAAAVVDPSGDHAVVLHAGASSLGGDDALLTVEPPHKCDTMVAWSEETVFCGMCRSNSYSISLGVTSK